MSATLFGADVYMYGSTSEANPYKVSGQKNGYPWGNGTFPTKNFTVIYSGTYDGKTWGGTNNGFIAIDKTVEMGNFMWNANLESTTANLTFVKGADGKQRHAFIVDGSFGAFESKANSYRGITLNFTSSENVQGEIKLAGFTWTGRTANEATSLVLNADKGTTKIKIGKGVTFNMSANATKGIQKIVNNLSGKNAGSLEVYNGGIINGKRIDIFGSGNSKHNDIIIQANSKMNVETLSFKESNARVQIAGTLQAAKSAILNNVITFDLQGNSPLVDLSNNGEVVANFGLSAVVHILNFKDNSIKLAFNESSKKFVERKFYTFDGKKWVNNLSLSEQGIVIKKK